MSQPHTPVTTKPGPNDLLRQLKDNGAEVYRAAYEQGMSLSAYLEREDPSDQYPNSRLDAFGRLLQAADIRTKPLYEHGIYASTWDQFAKGHARALVPEWWAREWRKVSAPKMRAGLVYNFDDAVPGSWARPWVDEASVRWDTQLSPAIPLSEMVAITIPIERPDYRTHYLTSDASAERKVRVEPGTEVPLAKLTSGDKTIAAKKYGRALEATYEQLRFQRLDEIALTIQRMAVRTEADKVQAALDIIINGDGNSGTAATSYNLTTLDAGATAGTLSLKGWLNWAMQWDNAYFLTTVIAQTASVLQLMLLNVGSANVPLVSLPGGMGFTQFSHINETADNVRVGRHSDAPALKLVGFDARLALKQLEVIGADIAEVERFTRNQTEVFTMTEMNAFAVLDANASKILDINA